MTVADRAGDLVRALADVRPGKYPYDIIFSAFMDAELDKANEISQLSAQVRALQAALKDAHARGAP